jgi:hypothetical protein
VYVIFMLMVLLPVARVYATSDTMSTPFSDLANAQGNGCNYDFPFYVFEICTADSTSTGESDEIVSAYPGTEGDCGMDSCAVNPTNYVFFDTGPYTDGATVYVGSGQDALYDIVAKGTGYITASNPGDQNPDAWIDLVYVASENTLNEGVVTTKDYWQLYDWVLDGAGTYSSCGYAQGYWCDYSYNGGIPGQGGPGEGPGYFYLGGGFYIEASATYGDLDYSHASADFYNSPYQMYLSSIELSN